MRDAVIVDAVRTPGGKRNGKLQDWHPAELGAHVLKALEERNGIDPSIIDDVIMGCVSQVGEQSLNIGPVSYTHLRAHETVLDLVCRLLLEKKK